MEELKSRVQQKAELGQQLLDLQAEKNKLKKDVFDLRIAANNEQVDVDRLEGFSVKGLLLQLSGKKEEFLEKERKEARYAKTKYEWACARLQSIELQLETIPLQMDELGNCEEQLLLRMQEVRGQDICQEQVQRVHLLRQVMELTESLQEAGAQLNAAIEELQSWIGADHRSSIVSRNYHAAEMDAFSKLEIYQNMLRDYIVLLSSAQLEMNTSDWKSFDNRYLEGMLFDQMNRCLEVAEQVTRISFQLKSALPKIRILLQQEQIAFMNALVNLSY